MSALINDYSVCHLYNIAEDDRPDGPFVIAQEAYDPLDELMITTMFLFRRDGQWIDEMSQPLLPEEQRYLVFYDSSEEAAKALETLAGGIPNIERHSLTLADLRSRISSLQGGGYITARAALADRYRTWKLSLRK